MAAVRDAWVAQRFSARKADLDAGAEPEAGEERPQPASAAEQSSAGLRAVGSLNGRKRASGCLRAVVMKPMTRQREMARRRPSIDCSLPCCTRLKQASPAGLLLVLRLLNLQLAHIVLLLLSDLVEHLAVRTRSVGSVRQGMPPPHAHRPMQGRLHVMRKTETGRQTSTRAATHAHVCVVCGRVFIRGVPAKARPLPSSLPEAGSSPHIHNPAWGSAAGSSLDPGTQRLDALS